METMYFAMSLVMLAAVQAQSGVYVKFLQSDAEINLLSQFRITCQVNRTLLDLVNDIDVEIIRQSNNETEIVLSRGARNVKPQPEFYSVMVSEESGSGVKIKYEFLKIRRQDEGKYVCRVTQNSNGDVLGEDSMEIEVIKPVENIYLKFGNLGPISNSSVDPIEVDPGNYSVVCTGEGSNPAATVRLYIDGQQIQKLATKTDRMESHVKEFRTIVTGNVPLKFSKLSGTVECIATTQVGRNLSVKFPFKTQVYDPDITCNVTEANPVQSDATITCTVDYEGLKIKSFKYEFAGDGSQHSGQTTAAFEDVSEEQISNTKVRVHLRLREGEDRYFESGFYLLVEHEDGHVTRQSVRLRKISGYGSAKEGDTRYPACQGSGGSSISNLPALMLFLATMMWLS